MKLSTLLTCVALPLAGFAAEEMPQATKTTSNSLNSVSVLAVLATALPQSLLNLALTNSKAVSSVISSEFAEGSTPHWFKELPTPIQTYLVPVTTVTQAPPGVTSGLPSQRTSVKTVTFSPLPRTQLNITRNMTMHRNTSTHHMSMSHTPTIVTTHTTTRSTTKSAGGASIPTAVVGAGIAGLVGVVGLLAL